MKREGRQHGMARTHQPWDMKFGGRLINGLDSAPTAGIFTKVSSKPTNHSKFTSRCCRPRCVSCHDHPACKSKDNTKGTHKLKNGSGDVSDIRLVSRRVVDSKHCSGLSATGFLDDLDDDENGLMGSGDVHDDEDKTSFVDVGQVWEQIYEDEGWCLVGET